MARSNDEIYKLMNDLRLEIKGDIRDLREFAEKTDEKVQKLVTAQATTNIKIGVISFIGSSLAGAIIAGIVGKILK